MTSILTSQCNLPENEIVTFEYEIDSMLQVRKL